MNINWTAVWLAIITVWLFIKRWTNNLSKILQPIIETVEEMARDGVIDKNERKILVMKAIGLLEQQGTIKLNFITRRIISVIVDHIAGKLPDFKISAEVKKLISEARQ